MKRLVYLLVVILILAAAVAVSTGPAILWIAQKELGKIFVGGEVSIGESQISPLRQISLFDIGIKRKGIYDFKIAEISADYNLTSILRGTVLKVTLKEAEVEVNLPKRNILDLKHYVSLGSQGLFRVEDLALLDLNLNVRSKDIHLDVRVSMELALDDLLIHSIDLDVSSLRSRKFYLEGGLLRAHQGSGSNKLYIQNIQYDKVKIEGLDGLVRIEGRIFFLDAFFAQVLDGRVQGNVSLKAGLYPEYLAQVDFLDLNLEGFVRDFDLGEKLQMSGLIGGQMILNGKGMEIEALSGDFSMAKTGGTFVIKDARMLENIARGSGQSLDILVESFKSYRYNDGVVTLSLEKDNLLIDMALDGEAGKRNLNVVVHDFKLTKDGL